MFTEPRLNHLVDEAQAAAKEALGAQYVLHFFDASLQGYGVAFSPGPLDAAAAEAAFTQAIATKVSAEDAAYLDERIYFSPTPYSQAQLDGVYQDLSARLAQTPYLIGWGTVCGEGAVRVRVQFTLPDTPENRVTGDAFVAPYGDLVRVEYGVQPIPANQGVITDSVAPLPVAPPTPQPRLTPRVRDHVALPARARCVRGGTLTVKPGKQVAKLGLAAGARRTSASAGRAAKLKLKARRTEVAVTVTLKDGSVATQSFTYRRC
ncbi:hypothetical protein OJ997_11395 [Solirubrobacter phytolaccae]|uniref:Uncharacterized protein n=1 Tax=Solirubrobacter phytolaccae TaxID=1404360 RepID=A0A9X3N9J3_9ACTN|nr:hypothetical protein [Solirubrobacter phytolaccae]MDA0180900.1 hypothetical protein [Solirubrobacter phytolaccae]